MLIAKFKVENYKSFPRSEEISLSHGVNVIVGGNDSGKTALIEALSLRIEDKPHESIKTVPYPGASREPASRVHVTFELGEEELKNLLLDNEPNFFVPLEDNFPDGNAKELFEQNWYRRSRKVACVFQSGKLDSAYLDGYSSNVLKSDRSLRFQIMRSSKYPQYDGVTGSIGDVERTIPYRLASHLRDRIYSFRAERLHVGQCKFGSNRQLSPDAANLPEVLNILQAHHRDFEHFNQLIKRVFPHIARISVRPQSSELLKIFVLSNPNANRDDLAMPLQDSGTGIGQVLAILYVASTAHFPRTIIIDEPQSFLHPGAIRRLFDVLKQYPQHQYIVTTHSPIVISSANPQKIFLVKKVDSESAIESINRQEKLGLEKILKDVGANLSDVFGADNILWVEGPTEETCFPLILAKIAEISLFGTVILGVLSTGDLEGRHSRRVFDIYKKLSQGHALLPPAIGFIFDQEGRTQKEQEDLIRQSQVENSKQTVFFTPRRMYENYLLNPQAIAFVISNIEGFSEEPIESDDVTKWIEDEERKWNKKYFGSLLPRNQENFTQQIWLEKVHGAKLLKEMFRHFSTGVEYDKKIHGLALTQWLIENSPEDLFEIAEMLTNVLGRIQPQ